LKCLLHKKINLIFFFKCILVFSRKKYDRRENRRCSSSLSLDVGLLHHAAQRRHVRHLPQPLRRDVPDVQGARRRVPRCERQVRAQLPHPLHREVDRARARRPALPDVPPEMAVWMILRKKKIVDAFF
jgi:hypothetical protein